MDKLLKKNLKIIRHNLKKFEQYAKDDLNLGLKYAKRVKKQVNEVFKFFDVDKDWKTIKKFKKVIAGLDVYIETTTKMNEYKENWD